MTLNSIAALFGAMFILAIVPAPSVFAVAARSIASGFTHGVVTAIGIVVGDFIFIILAVSGLWFIAESMGSLFILVKYLGGAYLIWLGVGLWRSKSKNEEIEGIKELSWWSNFLCGLFITLGDPRAILFYISFLSAFIELSTVSILDTGIIMVIGTIAVGGANAEVRFVSSYYILGVERSKRLVEIRCILSALSTCRYKGRNLFFYGKFDKATKHITG